MVNNFFKKILGVTACQNLIVIFLYILVYPAINIKQMVGAYQMMVSQVRSYCYLRVKKFDESIKKTLKLGVCLSI